MRTFWSSFAALAACGWSRVGSWQNLTIPLKYPLTFSTLFHSPCAAAGPTASLYGCLAPERNSGGNQHKEGRMRTFRGDRRPRVDELHRRCGRGGGAVQLWLDCAPCTSSTSIALDCAPCTSSTSIALDGAPCTSSTSIASTRPTFVSVRLAACPSPRLERLAALRPLLRTRPHLYAHVDESTPTASHRL